MLIGRLFLDNNFTYFKYWDKEKEAIKGFFSDNCCNFEANSEVEYIITFKEPIYVRKNTCYFEALYHSKSFDW
jgi:hypothetical protein